MPLRYQPPRSVNMGTKTAAFASPFISHLAATLAVLLFLAFCLSALLLYMIPHQRFEPAV